MNAILAMPIELRLVMLFVLGTGLGSLVNLGVYRLAWRPRSISPWSAPLALAPPRRGSDRVPIIGWLGLRREAALHGPGFWIRPMLLELLTGSMVAALYWWETGELGLLPPGVPRPAAAGLLAVVHAQFGTHVLLLVLMLMASVIDLDEKIIPDAVTVSGTLLGLALAALAPWSLLPSLAIPPDMVIPAVVWQAVRPDNWPWPHLLTSPNPWSEWLEGSPCAGSLALGLACWWLWCVALMPRTWYARHGWRRALRLCMARLARHPATYRIAAMGLISSLLIAGVWFRSGPGWQGLLTALVGAALGGGLIWLVRIIGRATLHKEAMGFGDVTLMAMLGSFLGWQTCLVVFFLAPLAALVVGIAQLVMRRGPEIPYGPFLCLAAAWTVVCWHTVWDRVWPVFALGWFVPLAVLFCMALMAVMLGLWRLIRSAWE